MYEITQQEVDGDFSKMHVKLKFRVTEVIGQDAITEFAGHEVLKDHVRRQVRRYRGKIDGVVDAITDDGYYVRIKPFMISQGRIKASQKRAMREAAHNVVLQVAARNTWLALQKQILSGELEQAIEAAARKIAAVRTVIVRKSQLVQDGVVAGDGPTLDDVREDEERAAEAKKAALAAAMVEDDDESEDESEDESGDETSDAPAEEAAEEAAPEAASDEAVDYTSLKVAELKELLKAAGKPVSGKKAELIARLSE
jgi:small subunit ribosomal protein S3Ae